MDWHSLPRLDEAAARERLGSHGPLLEREKNGCFVDPEVFVQEGASVLRGGSHRELTLPRDAPSVFVLGDLKVEGVLAQPFRSSPLWIDGDLEAGHVVTCGYLAVRGSVRVGGVFYGNCTNYCTFVCGDFSAGHLVLEKGHPLAALGEERTSLRLADEEDGPDATEEWMNALGVDAHDEDGLAAALRAGAWPEPTAP